MDLYCKECGEYTGVQGEDTECPQCGSELYAPGELSDAAEYVFDSER